MDDLPRALLAAWHKLRPRLEHDARELNRRLARRNQQLIQQPPRAWCIAIRASDTRLAEFCIHHSSLINHQSHNVLLTSDALIKLCRPVHLDPPGMTLTQVARKLGVMPHNLLDARLAGVFRTHHRPGPRGRLQPLLYTDRPLDPQARSFAIADPIWSITAATALGRIPPDISQTLTRVPVFRDILPTRHAHEDLHPEHPAVDRATKTRSKKLPPPEPDPVWYKWSRSGHFLGTDPANWRKGPQDLGERPPRDLPKHQRARPTSPRRGHKPQEDDLSWWFDTTPLDPGEPDIPQNSWVAGLTPDQIRERERQLFAEMDAEAEIQRDLARSESKGLRANSKSMGSLQFRGYRWKCPACGRKVNLLYYPLPRLTFLPPPPRPCRERAGVRVEAIGHYDDADDPPTDAPLNTFACKQCHRVKYTNSCAKSAWGEIVAYLSAGLLYGNEVPRPAWYRPKRKNKYAARLSAPPSRRRPQIEQLLLQGNTISQTASRLGLSKGTILFYTKRIYEAHNVRCLKELLQKHGLPTRPHMRGPAKGKRGGGRVPQNTGRASVPAV